MLLVAICVRVFVLVLIPCTSTSSSTSTSTSKTSSIASPRRSTRSPSVRRVLEDLRAGDAVDVPAGVCFGLESRLPERRFERAVLGTAMCHADRRAHLTCETARDVAAAYSRDVWPELPSASSSYEVAALHPSLWSVAAGACVGRPPRSGRARLPRSSILHFPIVIRAVGTSHSGWLDLTCDSAPPMSTRSSCSRPDYSPLARTPPPRRWPSLRRGGVCGTEDAEARRPEARREAGVARARAGARRSCGRALHSPRGGWVGRSGAYTKLAWTRLQGGSAVCARYTSTCRDGGGQRCRGGGGHRGLSHPVA